MTTWTQEEIVETLRGELKISDAALQSERAKVAQLRKDLEAMTKERD